MNLLKLPQVKAKTGLSTTTIYEAMNAGTFAKPVVQSHDKNGRPRSVAWLESEIDDWILARVAERDGKPVAPTDPVPGKRRRGRPPGSKNRKTLERLAASDPKDSIAA